MWRMLPIPSPLAAAAKARDPPHSISLTPFYPSLSTLASPLPRPFISTPTRTIQSQGHWTRKDCFGSQIEPGKYARLEKDLGNHYYYMYGVNLNAIFDFSQFQRTIIREYKLKVALLIK